MELKEIREQITQKGYGYVSLKDVLVEWLSGGLEANFDFGLTLMPKKVFYKSVPRRKANGDTEIFRHLNRIELEDAGKRFMDLLNKLVYKQAYKRFNRRLDIVMIIEGANELIDLHTHFAVRKPTEMSIKDFVRLVRKALEMSGEFEIQNPNYKSDTDCLSDRFRYKLDLIDSEWLSYITKKLDRREFRNLYLI